MSLIDRTWRDTPSKVIYCACMNNQWTTSPLKIGLDVMYACSRIRLKTYTVLCVYSSCNPHHYPTGDSAIRTDCTDEWWEARQWATPHRDRQEGVQVPTEGPNSLLPGCHCCGSSWEQVCISTTVIMVKCVCRSPFLSLMTRLAFHKISCRKGMYHSMCWSITFLQPGRLAQGATCGQKWKW